MTKGCSAAVVAVYADGELFLMTDPLWRRRGICCSVARRSEAAQHRHQLRGAILHASGWATVRAHLDASREVNTP
jgi:hypothetical protein